MESLVTWLSTPPALGEILDLFGVFCLLLLVPGFVISAYLAGPGGDRLARNPIQLAGIRHYASIGLWVFGAGLFFFGVRALQINPLSFGERKWLVASIVAIAFAAARCLSWWRTDYPAKLARRSPGETIPSVPAPGKRLRGAHSPPPVPELTARR